MTSEMKVEEPQTDDVNDNEHSGAYKRRIAYEMKSLPINSVE